MYFVLEDSALVDLSTTTDRSGEITNAIADYRFGENIISIKPNIDALANYNNNSIYLNLESNDGLTTPKSRSSIQCIKSRDVT